MTLSEKQALFTTLLGHLILFASIDPDTRLRFGWVYDPPNTGSKFRSSKSLHRSRLAADLIPDIYDPNTNAWVYQRSTKAYEPLGKYWESLHELCEWGGSGNRNDGNHFSLRHRGRW